MGRRTLIVFICMHLLVSCLRDTSGLIYYEFINNTGEVLEVLYPARYTYAVPFLHGDMYDLDKNTTMSGAGLKASHIIINSLENSSLVLFILFHNNHD